MNHGSYWKMVGRAVTMNLPDNPGLEVTSTCPIPMSRSSLHPAKSSQVGWRPLQAGHHGAKLDSKREISHHSQFESKTYNSTIHSPVNRSLQLSSSILFNFPSTKTLNVRKNAKIVTHFLIFMPGLRDILGCLMPVRPVPSYDWFP